MVAGAAADEAVAIARARPALAVGLHLVLVSGRPVSPPGEIPALVRADGAFSDSPVRAGLAYAFSGRARAELRREIRAQLEAFRRTGLPLSHVDGHLHLHVHPVVLGILRDLSSEFAIAAVRLPSEPLGATLALDRSGIATKTLHAAIFGLLRPGAGRRMREGGIAFAERVYGLLETGRITEAYLLGLVPTIRAARVELYCHPAVELPGEPRNGPPGSGPAELAALVSPRVREAVASSGFRLTTPAGLFADAPSPALAR